MNITEKQLKTIAKNTTTAYRSGTKITHSMMLETIADALGKKDFNALSTELKKDTRTDHKEVQSAGGTKTFADITREVEAQRAIDFPDFGENFLFLLNETDGYEKFLQGDSNDGEYYEADILVRLKGSSTKRVFYSLRTHHIMLYVYPETRKPIHSYDIPLDDRPITYQQNEHIVHLWDEKKWMNRNLQWDMQEIYRFIGHNLDRLKSVWKKTDQEKLDKAYMNLYFDKNYINRDY